MSYLFSLLVPRRVLLFLSSGKIWEFKEAQKNTSPQSSSPGPHVSTHNNHGDTPQC